jgi:hypothetical protein
MTSAYRIRFLSDGTAYRKGAWTLHRDSWTDFAKACDAAKAYAEHGFRVRVTTGTSIKPLAEFGKADRCASP